MEMVYKITRRLDIYTAKGILAEIFAGVNWDVEKLNKEEKKQVHELISLISTNESILQEN